MPGPGESKPTVSRGLIVGLIALAVIMTIMGALLFRRRVTMNGGAPVSLTLAPPTARQS